MKRKYFSTLLVTAGFLLFYLAPSDHIAAQSNSRLATPQTATLYNWVKHKDYGKSIFNFALGLRGDSKLPGAMDYDIRYAGLVPDGPNMDWFDLSMGIHSYSQIVDIGERKWSDIYDIPILLASQSPHSNGMRIDYNGGKAIRLTPENVVVRVVPGHMYVIHTKHDETDLYVLIRIETLKPEDECTISWAVVPSPEQPVGRVDTEEIQF